MAAGRGRMKTDDGTAQGGAAGGKAERASLAALRPLVPFALAYRGRIAAALVALVVAAGATLALPLAVRRVIDGGFSDPDSGMINAYFGTLVVVVAVLAVASAARYYLVTTLGERVVADLRTAVFRHLLWLDPGFYDSARSGDIASRLAADTTQIKAAFGASASIALRNLFLFLGAATMMVVTSPRLSALVLAAIPVIVLPLVASGRSVRRRSRAAQDRLADASAFATEAVGAIRTMQAFGVEAATAERYRAAAENAFEAARASIRARAYLTAVALFLIAASVVAVLWYGAQDVLGGRMSAGRLSQFVLYAVFAAARSASSARSGVRCPRRRARPAGCRSCSPHVRAWPRPPRPFPCRSRHAARWPSGMCPSPIRAGRTAPPSTRSTSLLRRASAWRSSGRRVPARPPSSS
jgi:ABC-type multidrug transport system, ATPase and permease components